MHNNNNHEQCNLLLWWAFFTDKEYGQYKCEDDDHPKTKNNKQPN